MLDNNLIQSTSSWPFVEVRKLLKDRKDLIKSKKKNSISNRIWPKWTPPYWYFRRSCQNNDDDKCPKLFGED